MSFLSIDPDGNLIGPDGKSMGKAYSINDVNDTDSNPSLSHVFAEVFGKAPLAHLGARSSGDVGEAVARWVEDQFREDSDG